MHIKERGSNIRFIAKTFAGLEEVLADEISAIGVSKIEKYRRAVAFSGSKEQMYKANLYLRTALRILMPVHDFKATNEEQLYKGIRQTDWRKYMDSNMTFAVDSVVVSQYFKHSKYVALKTKDAIADQFRMHSGVRPSVDVEDPDVRIHIHISGDACTVSLDSSGNTLFKRGYRKSGALAPLNEVLAAGMVLISGWKGRGHLIDPFCGSGTILTEAAMIAKGIPPGIYIKKFGFQSWKDYDRLLWERIRNSVRYRRNKMENMISGSDISVAAVRLARENIINAGVDDCIDIRIGSFEEFIPTEGGGTVITNPPYDERLKNRRILDLYKTIGDRLKRHYTGYDVWILGGNPEALKMIGLRPSEKRVLFNGPIECRYQKFSVYAGSMKLKYRIQ